MPPHPRIRVAIIDDDPTAVAVLSDTIDHRDDFTLVGTASTGAQGTEMVRRTQPDVVLVDHVLHSQPPGEKSLQQSGLELIATIKSYPFDPTVVLYSGLLGLRTAAANAGADLYITKGDDPSAVLDMVNAYVRPHGHVP